MARMTKTELQTELATAAQTDKKTAGAFLETLSTPAIVLPTSLTDGAASQQSKSYVGQAVLGVPPPRKAMAVRTSSEFSRSLRLATSTGNTRTGAGSRSRAVARFVNRRRGKFEETVAGF